jgi:hypothetical protein
LPSVSASPTAPFVGMSLALSIAVTCVSAIVVAIARPSTNWFYKTGKMLPVMTPQDRKIRSGHLRKTGNLTSQDRKIHVVRPEAQFRENQLQ